MECRECGSVYFDGHVCMNCGTDYVKRKFSDGLADVVKKTSEMMKDDR